MKDELYAALGDRFFDDLTDPNDSTCYTYYFADAANPFRLGSAELHAFLDAGGIAHYVKVQISQVQPLLCMIFCRYEASRTDLRTADAPFTAEQARIQSQLLHFAQESGLQVRSYSDLEASGDYARYFEPEEA